MPGLGLGALQDKVETLELDLLTEMPIEPERRRLRFWP